MKFKNAYDLFVFLSKKQMINGIYIGLRGELELISSIKNKELLEIIDEKFLEWYWHAHSESLAIHGGFYSLILNPKDNSLEIGNSIDDDILDFYGNPFDIETLLNIVVDFLLLENVDKDDYLEHQICINLKLSFENINDNDYKIDNCFITSFEENNELSNELLSKLNEKELNKLKLKIVKYLKNIHLENFRNEYKGFELIIDENYFSSYSGIGYKLIDGFKNYMENQIFETEIDISTYNIK
jgi:hypothetical protein